jgi:hypothetical protein
MSHEIEQPADLLFVADAPPGEPIAMEVSGLDRQSVGFLCSGADPDASEFLAPKVLRLGERESTIDPSKLMEIPRWRGERAKMESLSRFARNRDLDRSKLDRWWRVIVALGDRCSQKAIKSESACRNRHGADEFGGDLQRGHAFTP